MLDGQTDLEEINEILRVYQFAWLAKGKDRIAAG
jgi:hypothetical protein